MPLFSRGIFVSKPIEEMKDKKIEFQYKVYQDIAELTEEDASLLSAARKMALKAYAPYSKFFVGAVAMLENGEIVAGTNQENASYPVGMCAERVLMGAAATMYPDVPVKSLAISYHNSDGESGHPISPCGMCRQALLEFETRTKKQMRVILSGQQGEVYIIDAARLLLPFAFTSDELK